MEFYGEIQNGILILPAAQLVQREYLLRSIKNGSRVIETIKKTTKPKTWSQCKTIFGLAFHQIMVQFDDRGWDSSTLLNIDRPTGVPVDSDMLRKYFYSLFPTYRDDKLITLSYPMTTTETATFYDNIGNWSASQWSIVIPPPDVDWKTNRKEN